MGCRGKVALVTGGGSGIGRATCEIFAERGGAVMMADLKEAAAKATAKRIAGKGGRAQAIRCDVTLWADVQAAVDTARGVFGQLDVVINSAGILRGSRLEDTSEAEWNEVLRINLTGAFLVSKAAAPLSSSPPAWPSG